jgi:SAM-dependent methyltransferase
VEADAEALPFDDGEFDVVTSTFGAMFAPDHQKVADELVRVCRPGGTIGLLNLTPEGLAADLFGVFAPYLPAPSPGALPPVLWGSEEHVREPFGDRVESLEMTAGSTLREPQARATTSSSSRRPSGPRWPSTSLGDQPVRAAALDREFLEFAMRSNRGALEGLAEYHYEYLLVVARKRDG